MQFHPDTVGTKHYCTIPFCCVPRIINAMATTNIIHMQMNTNLNQHHPSKFKDIGDNHIDYHLKPAYIACYDPEETLELQIIEHMEKRTISWLKEVLEEKSIPTDEFKTKFEFIRAVLRVFKSTENGLNMLRQKLRIGRQYIVAGSGPQWQCCIVYEHYLHTFYNVYRAENSIKYHEDEARLEYGSRYKTSRINTDVFIPSISRYRESKLPKSWMGDDDDILVTGVRKHATASRYRKAVYRLRPLRENITNAELMEHATRCLDIPAENVPTDWEAQVDSIESFHRTLMLPDAPPAQNPDDSD